MTRLGTAAVAVTLAALVHTRDCAGTSSSGTRAAMAPTAAAPPTAVPSPSPPPAPTAVPDLFAGAVRPILKAHCAPCHEPGGRLYDRLPFDDARVVSSHSPGILRRLKGEDRAALEQWLATLKPAS
jgi:hypothetical protein